MLVVGLIIKSDSPIVAMGSRMKPLHGNWRREFFQVGSRPETRQKETIRKGDLFFTDLTLWDHPEVQGKRKRGTPEDTRLRSGPWSGARVASQQSPTLRPGEVQCTAAGQIGERKTPLGPIG